MIERVYCLLPLALTAREHFDESRVLERDAGLSEHRAREHEGAFIECVGADAFQRNGADGSRARHDGHAQPARRGWAVCGRAQLGRAVRHAIGKDEGPAPQRQLQERLVGGRGTRTIVIGDGQPVGVEVEEQHRQAARSELLGEGARHDFDDRGGPKRTRQLLR